MNAIPLALLREERELPFVGYQEGITFQLVQANIASGYWVVRLRSEPGRTIQRHRHTGEVFAFTLAGSWRDLEYPEVNVAGSFLYEPAGSIHTLHVPATNTEVTDVWFVIHGANLNLDDAGNVESVLDAGTALEIYRAQCAAAGLPEPEFEGSDLNFAGWAKKLTGVPTIAVGSVGLTGEFIASYGGEASKPASLDELLRRLDRGDFDLVGVGRALLQDPQWAVKVHQGRTDELMDFDRSAMMSLS